LNYTRDRAVISVGSTYNDREATFFVEDNGVLFDIKYKEKLFGVFQRLHTSEEFEGTGIGFANVRRIVNRHGGRIWAEGREGKGATFFSSLPRPTETDFG
jgi:light-regulated signal transduction histidine kinase (bacteriophytochrome)